MTRTLVLSSLVLFLGTSLQLVWPYYFVNVWELTVFKLQVWRPCKYLFT